MVVILLEVAAVAAHLQPELLAHQQAQVGLELRLHYLVLQ
jgi:hypothetical protein